MFENFSNIAYIGGAILIAISFLIFNSSKKKGDVSHFRPAPKGASSVPFTLDITQLAREGNIDPVIGRDEEIIRMTQILTRRRKNNVILVGDPGVGKTAIVEGLALKIITGDVPIILKDKKVFKLQVADMISGTKYRGEFEERVKQLVNQIQQSNRTIILFIDEIHTIMQTKGTEGSMNISDILKPSLARGELQVIGATTKKEYEQYIAADASWERRFQCLEVGEPNMQEAIEILQGLKHNYETYHKVIFTDEAIKGAVVLSQKYIKGRTLPDKAIDLMDEAAAMVNVHEGAAPDHAVALLYGAANNLSQKHSLETDKIKELKKELVGLRRQEDKMTDAEKIKGIRKQIVDTVKKIQEEESDALRKNGWPEVTLEHIKEVVAEWANMDKGKIV